MSRTVSLDNLGSAIAEELTLYRDTVVERVNSCSESAIKDLVKKTKATAPKRSGAFRKSITWKADNAGHGMKEYTWYVKAPHHRLTHLLVHGHAKKDGGRTKADPFLNKALEQVLPDYERDVEEAISNG